MSDLTRITINLSRPARAALIQLVEASGSNHTDVINAALVLARIAGRHATPDGELTILRPDGTRVIAIVPHIPSD